MFFQECNIYILLPIRNVNIPNNIHTFSCPFIWALKRQNLSSEFPTKEDSNHSPHMQLLGLARNLKICLLQV